MDIKELREKFKQISLDNLDLIEFADNGEWLKIRESGIGGSDVGTILGLNKYKSDYTLFLEKTKQKEVEDISGKEAVIRGKNAEEHLIGLLNTYYPNKKFFTPPCTFRRKDKPWMLGNLDGISEDLTEGLEIKTACVSNLDDWRDKIPDTYYCQILYYMAITGLKKFTLFASVEVRSYDGSIPRRHLIEHQIVRNDEEIKFLEDKVEEFWNKIISKKFGEFNFKSNI